MYAISLERIPGHVCVSVKSISWFSKFDGFLVNFRSDLIEDDVSFCLLDRVSEVGFEAVCSFTLHLYRSAFLHYRQRGW